MSDARDNNAATPAALRRTLLGWYDRNARDLPWRAPPGRRPEPYGVWLSEVMLQQTTVATVGPYYQAFLRRWPDVHSLAAAPLEAVLTAWQGLGYYARARHLHACAQAIVAQHGGSFPRDAASLRRLPGIGLYTAQAVAAICFGQPVLALDGNGERVLARLHAVTTPLPAAKRELARHAARLASRRRPGDLLQALMDLGASVCLPRRPKCPDCPWRQACRARALGIADGLPMKRPKPDRPLRHGLAFVALSGEREVLLRTRPLAGLLGGMVEVPGSDWGERPGDDAELLRAAPLPTAWQALVAPVEHDFTHFRLRLFVHRARIARQPVAGCFWWPLVALDSLPLSTLTRKVLRAALPSS